MNKIFTHHGLEYRVESIRTEGQISARAYLEGSPVSATYIAQGEIINDYSISRCDNLELALMDLAEQEVKTIP